MANNLAISVTAQTGAARAQLALLQQDLRQLGQAMRRAAADARSSDIDGGAGAKLTALASQFETARAAQAKFQADLKETATGFGGLSAAIKEPLEGLAMMRSSLRETAEVAGLTYAIDKLKEFTVSMAEAGEKALNMAFMLGISVKELAELQGVFTLAGGDADEAGRTFRRLGLAVQQATVDPTGQAATAFKNLGISLDEVKAKGGNLLTFLKLLIERYSELDPNIRNIGVLQEVTSKGIENLIPAMRKGADGWEEMAAKSKDYQAAMTAATPIEAAEAERLNALTLAGKTLAHDGFMALAPIIYEVTDAMVSLAQEIDATIKGTEDDIQNIMRLGDAFQDFLSKISGGLIPPATPGAGADLSLDLDVTGKRGGRPLGTEKPGAGKGAKGQESEIEAWREELEQKLVAEHNFFSELTAEELAFWQSKVALTTAGSKEQAQVNKIIFDLQKRQAQQNERDQEEAISGQQRISDAIYQLKLQKVQYAAALNQTTAAQEVQQEQSLLAQKFALDQQYFAAKLEAAQNDVKERLKLLNEEKLAQIKFVADQTKLVQQAALKWQQELQSALSPIKTSVVSGLEGILNQTKTPAQAASGVGTAALDAVFSKLGDVLFNRLGQLITSVLPDVFKTALGIGTATAEITAITVTGPAATALAMTPILEAQTAQLLVPLTTIAIATAAKAVPVVGQVLAQGGIIGSAAGGWTVPSFASGGVLSILHQREMVLPRHISEFVQDAAANYRGEGAAVRPSSSGEPWNIAAPAAVGGNRQGDGDHFHLHVHAPDGPAAHKFLVSNMHSVAEAFHKATRNGSLGRK